LVRSRAVDWRDAVQACSVTPVMTILDQPRTEGTGKAISTQITVVALLFGLSAASYFCRLAMSITAPEIMREFHVSETRMGIVQSAFLFSYTLAMTPAGWLSDRFGGRVMLIISGLGAALFTALTAYATVPGLGALLGVIPALLIIRSAFGVFTAPLYPSCGRIVSSRIRPERQGRALAVIVSAAGVGSAVSPVIYTHVIQRLGWRSCFLLAGVVTVGAVALFAAAAPRRDDTHGETARAQRGEWRALLANRNLLLITGSYFALNYFQYIFYYWIYYYFIKVRSFGPGEATVATTATYISMAIMTPIGGYLSDRAVKRFGVTRGRRVVPIVAMVLSALLLYIGASGWGIVTTIILLSLAVGCALAPEGAFWSSAIAVSGQRAGGATGIMNFGGNLGGAVSPTITPWIASRFGWAGGLYAASVMIAAGMLAWFFIDPAESSSAGDRV
jgi:ACS family glucarate transporter-like MFS transporter